LALNDRKIYVQLNPSLYNSSAIEVERAKKELSNLISVPESLGRKETMILF